MPRDINIEIVHAGPCWVVHIRGEIDLKSSPAFRAAILNVFERDDPEGVILDLAGVNHMDSSGIASLIEGWHEAKKRGARFILSDLNEGPRRVLDLTRLSGVFEIASTLEEALGRSEKVGAACAPGCRRSL